MSQPTQQELARLPKNGDDEMFHLTFDKLLEEKLMQLDPEWITAMQRVYHQSGMRRWYA